MKNVNRKTNVVCMKSNSQWIDHLGKVLKHNSELNKARANDNQRKYTWSFQFTIACREVSHVSHAENMHEKRQEKRQENLLKQGHVEVHVVQKSLMISRISWSSVSMKTLAWPWRSYRRNLRWRWVWQCASQLCRVTLWMAWCITTRKCIMSRLPWILF